MVGGATPSIPLVAIVGPTGVGKTALALRLAPRFNGEIVGADSRQVYRGMDIGTGKPTAEERAAVPHHLVDVADPDEEFNVSFFQAQATAAVEEVHGRGRLPFLVGGTGHYVWALLEGLRLPQVPPNLELRRDLAAIAEEEGGLDFLHAQLADLDPVAAARIDPRNARRVIRAIEVSRATGLPFSQVGTREPPPYRGLIIGLTCPREELYRRIDARVDAMVARGWVDEVRRLMDRGYGLDLPSMSSLGYREIAMVVEGRLGLEEAVARVKMETHRFARRQYGWFRLTDPRIRWLDITACTEEKAEEWVREFLDS